MPPNVKSILLNVWIYRSAFLVALAMAMYWAIEPFHRGPAMFAYQDKVGHALAFFLLTMLLDLSRWFDKKSLQVLLLATYGVVIEAVQYFIPHRSTEFADFVADALGIFLYFIVRSRINPNR